MATVSHTPQIARIAAAMVGPGWRWDPGFGFPASRSSVLGSFQQVRQLGPVDGDAPRLIARKQVRGTRGAGDGSAERVTKRQRTRSAHLRFTWVSYPTLEEARQALRERGFVPEFIEAACLPKFLERKDE